MAVYVCSDHKLSSVCLDRVKLGVEKDTGGAQPDAKAQ